jgi:hypothetical protein
MFCDNTALNTGGAGDYLIGNQIDIGDLRDLGQGTPLYLVIAMTVTATSGGSATGQFTLVSDAAAAMTIGTATEHVSSPVFPVASMTAGTRLLAVVIPLEGNTYERFLGIKQTTGTAAFTAGNIDAFLTLNPQAWKAYTEYEGV